MIFLSLQCRYGHGLNRLKPIFEFSLTSLSETIRPNVETASLIRRVKAEIASITQSAAKSPVSGQNTPNGEHKPSYIGIHVRRGDKLATSWAFHNGYVPIPNYAQAALDTWSRLQLSSAPLTLYIASDSPSAQHELANAFPPDTRVLSLSLSDDPELKALKSPGEYVQAEFARLGETERKQATRGMIVDFAMISGMWAGESVVPEATICTIRCAISVPVIFDLIHTVLYSSSVCRLSAVGLGWDRAFGAVDKMGSIDEQGKRWVEIDNRDVVRPVWEAYQLFI
jgi:hypothetical protein